jgi:alginate O-acetyltransferase complex protein AlgI
MNFISWAFVLLFIPVFVARLVFGRRKNERPFVWLTMVASTIFVMWHVPAYILIMLTSIGVDYVAALLIDRSPDGAPRRKLFLALSMATNLAILGFFKYTNFALINIEKTLHLAHVHANLPRLGLILPMGISFYTFGSMSYTVDVYRKRLKAVTRFQDFYYFVTFFPHLVAGPIIRAEQFFYQVARTRRLWLRVFNQSAYLIIRGMFLKMVCADNIAVVVNARWADGYVKGGTANSVDLILLTLLFAAQIFCDFEGYSSIARGLAYLMGFRFPVNFDNPYIAGSFSNFWERWHITLSRWLRDYLYIPLGGNRRSAPRVYLNLLTVMLLGGLWHGASLTFVVWGAIHGLALAGERGLGLNKMDADRCGQRRLARFGWFVAVQIVVMVAWIFFRSEHLGGAVRFIQNISRLRMAMPSRQVMAASLFIVPVAAMHVWAHLVEARRVRPLERLGKAIMVGVMLFLALVAYGESSEFIYFQF